MAQIEDVVGILRRLWAGEAVMGHDGPAGRFAFLQQDPTFAEDIPVMLVALGERTLEFAGGLVDGVVLHTFFTDEALARSVAAVRRGAEKAGRDPAAVRVWSVLATVGDHIDEELRLRKLAGRLATYLQGYGDLLVRVNGWDPDELARIRQADVMTGARGRWTPRPRSTSCGPSTRSFPASGSARRPPAAPSGARPGSWTSTRPGPTPSSSMGRPRRSWHRWWRPTGPCGPTAAQARPPTRGAPRDRTGAVPATVRDPADLTPAWLTAASARAGTA